MKIEKPQTWCLRSTGLATMKKTDGGRSHIEAAVTRSNHFGKLSLIIIIITVINYDYAYGLWTEQSQNPSSSLSFPTHVEEILPFVFSR